MLASKTWNFKIFQISVLKLLLFNYNYVHKRLKMWAFTSFYHIRTMYRCNYTCKQCLNQTSTITSYDLLSLNVELIFSCHRSFPTYNSSNVYFPFPIYTTNKNNHILKQHTKNNTYIQHQSYTRQLHY